MYKIFIFLFFTFFLPSFVEAKNSLSVSLSDSAISPQDRLTLKVEIEYDDVFSDQSPRLLNLDQFDIIGKSSSSEIRIGLGVSGSVNRKIYEYSLRPKGEGVFKIGPVEVMIDGKLYRSRILKVKVSSQIKPRPKKPRKRQSRFGLFPPLFDQIDKNPFGFFQKPESIREEDFFLKLGAVKKKVYLGEMIVANWFFYFKGNYLPIRRSEILKSPELNGFWVENVILPGTPMSLSGRKTEIIDEVLYNKRLFMSSALFPIHTGVLKIGSLDTENIMGFGGFQKSQKFRKKSLEQKIQVMPLPTEGRGNFFTSAVGDFYIFANLNEDILSVDEPAIYSVIFKGKGDPRIIRLPKLDFGKVFELYDVTNSENFSVSKSKKTFEFVLLPKMSGDFTIPSFELTTFDPELGIYKVHVLPPMGVKIIGSRIGKKKDRDEKFFKKKSIDNEETPLDKEKEVFTPWLEGEKESFLSSDGRKKIWFVVYIILALLFFLALKEAFPKRKATFLEVLLNKSEQETSKKIKKTWWKEAGMEMNQVVYLFLSELSGGKVALKNLDVLLRSIHPSLRIRYESEIRNLLSSLDRLSFAPDELAKDLRTEQEVKRLRDETFGLLKKIWMEQQKGKYS